MKRGKKNQKLSRKVSTGQRARSEGHTLKTYQVGALPIVNSMLEQIELEPLLARYLPPDDPRCEVPSATALMVLIRNLLMSREPLYGVGEWALQFPPCALGLTDAQLAQLNDDRIGRCLDRLFHTGPDLILAVVKQVIKRFEINLDELHNDATLVSFFGGYHDASHEGKRGDKRTVAITWGGRPKDRPNLKKILYSLTITEDGGVPLYYSCHSGNTTDDTTHRATWDLLRQLVGRPDFLYVADSKLCTRENMMHIAAAKGRFITVLPRTRGEDKQFRNRLRQREAIDWEDVLHLTDDNGELRDSYRVCRDSTLSAEGFVIHWFHGNRKQENDAQQRATNIERASGQLSELREKTRSPRTRLRTRAQTQPKVDRILKERGVVSFLRVEIEEVEEETFKQAKRGRPGKDTQYVKQVSNRVKLNWQIDQEELQEAALCDGVFPLITNDTNLSAREVLLAYKRQPLSEKRFSQFKSDFDVAPVYLKNVARIQALLCAYFFVLIIQALLERQLRLAMAATNTKSLPLYPEERDCRRPTTRRVLDIFEPIQRHTLHDGTGVHPFVTDLQPVHREILRLLGISAKTYGE